MFSIITPSFRSGEWLKLCLASVADQNVPLEHIVQDAGSDDGTLDWLRTDPRVKAVVEQDQGMYDAINRGLRRAQGDVAAWLNCDEQYLPGALLKVACWFAAHPEAEVLFGDVVVVDPDGRYLRHRKMQVPLLHHTWTCHLSTLSCGMFFRRRLTAECGFFFDPHFRAGGDGEWMVRLLRAGVRMGTLNGFTSVFTETGGNLGAGSKAASEAWELRATAPFWARCLQPLLVAHHRWRRLAGGMYSQRPFAYEIYTRGTPAQRTRFDVPHPRRTW